jgi:hypothetical protein
MSIKRIEMIAELLDKRLSKYGFVLKDEPMIDDTTKMAAFTNPNGLTADYALTIEEDNDRGDYASHTAISLSVRIYNGGVSRELFPHKNRSSNMSLKTNMKDVIADYIEPGLKQISEEGLI